MRALPPTRPFRSSVCRTPALLQRGIQEVFGAPRQGRVIQVGCVWYRVQLQHHTISCSTVVSAAVLDCERRGQGRAGQMLPPRWAVCGAQLPPRQPRLLGSFDSNSVPTCCFHNESLRSQTVDVAAAACMSALLLLGAVCTGMPPASLLNNVGSWPSTCGSSIPPGGTCTASCPYGTATIQCGGGTPATWQQSTFTGFCSNTPGKHSLSRDNVGFGLAIRFSG